ncbi:MAG: DMT family transporter [Xanthomonadales bacterium]|nr:DMT family transporter [Xanthomonadales bacterium]
MLHSGLIDESSILSTTRFQQMANQVFFACLMLATGIGIPIMAALSSKLGATYGSPSFAASVLFLVALCISVAFLLTAGGGLKLSPKAPIPFYFYLGGVFVAFYVLSVTWVAPQFGVGNAVAFVLLGQLISMAAIDQFGLLGAQTHVISLQRAIGLVLMSVGVFLAVRHG